MVASAATGTFPFHAGLGGRRRAERPRADRSSCAGAAHLVRAAKDSGQGQWLGHAGLGTWARAHGLGHAGSGTWARAHAGSGTRARARASPTAVPHPWPLALGSPPATRSFAQRNHMNLNMNTSLSHVFTGLDHLINISIDSTLTKSILGIKTL